MENEFVRVLGADGDARQFRKFVWDAEWSDMEISSFIGGKVVRLLVSREEYEEDRTHWTESNADLVVRDIVCFEYMESVASILGALGDRSIEDRYAMHVGLASWLEVLEAFTRVDASVLASTGGVQVRGLRAFTLTLRRVARAALPTRASAAAKTSTVEVKVEVETGGSAARSRPRLLSIVGVRAATVPLVDVAHALARLAIPNSTGAEILRVYGFRMRGWDGSLLRASVQCERRVVLKVRARRTCIVCDETPAPLVAFVGDETETAARRLPKNVAICESHGAVSLWGVRFATRQIEAPIEAPPGGAAPAALELAVVAERRSLEQLEQIKRMPKWRMSAWQRNVCFANYVEAILARGRKSPMGRLGYEIVRRIVAHVRALMVPGSRECLLRAHKIKAFRGPTSPCYDACEAEPLCFYDFLRSTWRHLVA
jgi:hypothetical protein